MQLSPARFHELLWRETAAIACERDATEGPAGTDGRVYRDVADAVSAK
jgi:hypothetical protein